MQVSILSSNDEESHLICVNCIPPGATAAVVEGMTVVIRRCVKDSFLTFIDVDDVPMDSPSTNLVTLTPSMEAEAADWLRTVGWVWAQRQEEEHGVPADVWLAQVHHLTNPRSKRQVGLNTWNSYQKWWKHHHPDERPLGSDNAGKAYILSLVTMQ